MHSFLLLHCRRSPVAYFAVIVRLLLARLFLPLLPPPSHFASASIAAALGSYSPIAAAPGSYSPIVVAPSYYTPIVVAVRIAASTASAR